MSGTSFCVGGTVGFPSIVQTPLGAPSIASVVGEPRLCWWFGASPKYELLDGEPGVIFSLYSLTVFVVRLSAIPMSPVGCSPAEFIPNSVSDDVGIGGGWDEVKTSFSPNAPEFMLNI